MKICTRRICDWPIFWIPVEFGTWSIHVVWMAFFAYMVIYWSKSVFNNNSLLFFWWVGQVTTSIHKKSNNSLYNLNHSHIQGSKFWFRWIFCLWDLSKFQENFNKMFWNNGKFVEISMWTVVKISIDVEHEYKLKTQKTI